LKLVSNDISYLVFYDVEPPEFRDRRRSSMFHGCVILGFSICSSLRSIIFHVWQIIFNLFSK